MACYSCLDLGSVSHSPSCTSFVTPASSVQATFAQNYQFCDLLRRHWTCGCMIPKHLLLIWRLILISYGTNGKLCAAKPGK